MDNETTKNKIREGKFLLKNIKKLILDCNEDFRFI